MAYISVKADDDGGLRTLHERVTPSDFDNELFCVHLVERLCWAVEDTHRIRDASPLGAGLEGWSNTRERDGRAKEPVVPA